MTLPVLFGSINVSAGVRVGLDGSVAPLSSAHLPQIDPPASATFSVATGTPWVVLSAAWTTVSASVPFQLQAPDGTIYTESDLPANIAVLDEPDNTIQLGIGIENPAAGDWTLILPDTTNLGTVTFDGVGGTVISGAQLVFLQSPVNAISGADLSETVVAIEDQNGDVISTDNSVVTLTITGGPANSSTTLTSQAENGIGTFTGVAPQAAGGYTLQATDGTYASATTNFTVAAAGVASLAFAQQPADIVAGELMDAPVAVTATDTYGNAVSGDTVTLSIESSPSGKLYDTCTAISDATGTASFPDLVLPAAGTYSLVATDGAVSSGNSGTFTVAPASASSLTFFQQPGNVSTGGAFSAFVNVEDDFGNLVTTDNRTIVLSLNGDGVLNGALSAQVQNGVATFNGLSLNSVGIYTLVAGNGPLAATSDEFTVTRATAAVTLPQPPASINYDGTADVTSWAVPLLSGAAEVGDPTGTPVDLFYAGSLATGNPLGSTPTAAGTYTVVGVYPGDVNYDAVTSSAVTFTIAPAPLTITPQAGQSMVYGSTVPALGYDATGFASGDSSSLLTGSLGTTANASSPVGTYSFTADSLNAGPNYAVSLAPNAPDFAVTAATLTITPDAGQSMVYGSAVPVLTYTASGFANGDSASLLTGLLGSTATSKSSVGSCQFTLGSLDAGENYSLAMALSPPTFAVTPATLTITPDAGQSMPYGSAVPILTYTAAGFANGDSASVLTGLLGTTATSSSPLGTYAFSLGTLSAGADYTLMLAQNPPAFTVSPGPAGPITTDRPTFAWTAVAGAAHYSLTITHGKKVVLTAKKIAATSYTLPAAHLLAPGQSYIWSVTPLNAKGKAIGPSSKLAFQVMPLGAPTAAGPTGTIATDRPTFTWLPVIDANHTPANHFTLTISDTKTKQVLTIKHMTGTSYTLSTAQALTPGHSFTWSVTAVSSNGKVTARSQNATFTIAPLAAPTGLTFTNTSGTFSWQAVTDAGHYSLEVVNNTSRKAVIEISDLAGTTHKLSSKQAKELKTGHSYTWYVKAISTNGKASARSAAAAFTAGTGPEALRGGWVAVDKDETLVEPAEQLDLSALLAVMAEWQN